MGVACLINMVRCMSRKPGLLRRLLAPAIRKGRGFARDEDGVTVIEFAILGLPFFTIILAILETSLVFFAGQILDSGVQDASRLVRTGQAQTSAWDDDDFREALCGRLYGLFDCNQLRIRTSVVGDFTSATVVTPVEVGEDCDDSCDWTLEQDYSPGEASEVVLVQAWYKWPTIVNLPGFNLQTQPDGTRLLGAVRVFRNEPFGCLENCEE